MNRFVKSSAYLLLIIPLAACQLSFLGSQINSKPTPTAAQASQLQPTPASNPAPVIVDLSENEDILVNLYERVNPGVVAIQILNEEGGSLGSGFVFDEEGHIVTNYHVVEGATDLEVDFPSGFKARGNVIGKDLDSDLAVVKVEASPAELFPLPLGNSDLIRVGQTVVAIGNPFGLLGTMTTGIVSAKGRTMESLRTSSEGNYFTAGDMIQTDAAINPGNSGGPLLNLNGEVIGLNRAIRTTGITDTGDPVNSGIGYAISSNIISRVIPTIIEKGSYDYPYLGVTSREDMSLLVRETLGLTRSSGAYVIAVSPGGPAEEAGIIGGTRQSDIPGLLAGGDLIIAIDGRPVHVFSDLLSYLVANKSPGDTVTLNIVRDDQEKEVQVVLDKRP
jgi:S1-C subfamily serine protease